MRDTWLLVKCFYDWSDACKPQKQEPTYECGIGSSYPKWIGSMSLPTEENIENAIRLEKGQIGKIAFDCGSRNKLFAAFPKANELHLRTILYALGFLSVVLFKWVGMVIRRVPLKKFQLVTCGSKSWLWKTTCLRNYVSMLNSMRKNILTSLCPCSIIFKLFSRHSHLSTWAADCSNNYHS